MDQDKNQELGFNNGSLSALLHGSMELDAGSFFTKDIYLAHQAIVGMRYQGGADELIEGLKAGSRVTLLREPDNRYDKRAVMALDEDGRQIGYIPRHQNAIISALMDAGKMFYGIVPSDEERQAYLQKREGYVTPGCVYVELYMREYSSPEDIRQIPRQGDRGSYAVVCLEQDKSEEISAIYALKIINGEERGCFDERIQDAGNRDQQHALIAGFEHFTGMLPLVVHGIEGETKKCLSEEYGVLLGKPFSNRTIDTMVMAKNHIPFLDDYSLQALDRELGSLSKPGIEGMERCCRMTWELYRRLCRSELEKKEQRSVREIPLSELSEESRINCREEIVLTRAGILLIGDLMDRSENDLLKIRNLGRKSVERLKEILNSYQVSFEEEDYEPANITFNLPDTFYPLMQNTADKILKDAGIKPENIDSLTEEEKTELITKEMDKSLQSAERLHSEELRISFLLLAGLTGLYTGDYSDAIFSIIHGTNGMDMEKENGFALLGFFYNAWHKGKLQSKAKAKMIRVCLTLAEGILIGDYLSEALSPETKRGVVTSLCQEAFSYAPFHQFTEEDRVILNEIGTLFEEGKVVTEDGVTIETEPNQEISYKAFFYAGKVNDHG